MSENTNNVIQFPQRSADTQPVDTSVDRKHFWDRLTRRGKVVVSAGAFAAVSTVVAATGPEVPTEPRPDVHNIKIDDDKSVTDFGTEKNDEENLITYTVKQGDGVNEVVANVYGVDDGETVYNNAHYDQEVAAVREILDGQLLQPGQEITLPATFETPSETGE